MVSPVKYVQSEILIRFRYTFWAVVFLGGLSLLLSIAQTALSAAQVHYAAHPPSVQQI